MTSPINVAQRAGDRATQIGVVYGDVYTSYIVKANLSDEPIDVGAYRQGLRESPQFASKLIELDVERLVYHIEGAYHADQSRYESIGDVVRQYSRLLLLGNAGAGKTASLRFMMSALGNPTSEAFRHQPELADAVPVYVELSRFRAADHLSPFESLLAIVAESIFSFLPTNSVPSPVAVGKLLLDHKVVLLLDGLNEVAPHLRKLCIKSIDDLSRKYPSIHIVLTNRASGAEEMPNWKAVGIRELTADQIAELAGRYLPPEQVRSFLERVSASGGLLRLPLFLKFAIDLAHSESINTREISGSQSAMVAQYARFLLRRGLSQCAPEQPLGGMDQELDYVIALQSLASIFRRQGQSIPISAAIAGLGPDRASSLSLLSRLCDLGMLVRTGEYIRFWHQTLLDFFYARSFAEQSAKITIPFLARQLKRLIRTGEQDEPLTYLIAHVDDERCIVALIRIAIQSNAPLALAWMDDLAHENRLFPALSDRAGPVFSALKRASRYSRLSDSPAVFARFLFYAGLPLVLILAIPALFASGSVSFYATSAIVIWVVLICQVPDDSEPVVRRVAGGLSAIV